MNKVLSYIITGICACTSLTAMATQDDKFVNPIVSVDSLPSGAVAKLFYKSKCEYDEQMLTPDTTINYQPIELSGMIVFTHDSDKWSEQEKQEISKKYLNYNLLLHCTDIYEHSTTETSFNFNSLITIGLKLNKYGASTAMSYAPTQAGHHKWLIAKNGTDTIMSGKVVMERKPQVSIIGNNGQSEIIETQSFDIISKIKSGYPYNVEQFQGTVHYKVLAPDSTLVFEKDLKLNASPDSTLLEYIQTDTLGCVNNAKKGTYYVELSNAPWIEGGKATYMIWVMDPFMGATSDNPREVTLVVKNNTFKEKFDGWKYQGPERNEIAADDNSSAIMIGSPEADPREIGFTLEQTIDSVPAGWYKLYWNGYYQPGSTTMMTITNPVLAEVYGGDKAQKLEHIYNSPMTEESEGFVNVMIPKNANSALQILGGRYPNNVIFEQKEAGPLTIGAKAQASEIFGATTVLGTPKLYYYGEGKAYGKVIYHSTDTIFAPKDTIKYVVNLFDGVGVAVPDTNKVWIKMYKSTDFNKENLVLDSVYTAAKAGDYNLEFIMPDSVDFKPGTYYINAGTLHDGTDYCAECTNIIKLKFKEDPNAVKEVAEDPRAKNSRNRIYDLSGRRVSSAAVRKGKVYINSGKKVVK